MSVTRPLTMTILAVPVLPSAPASQEHVAMASPTPTRPRAPPTFQHSNGAALNNHSTPPGAAPQAAASHQPYPGPPMNHRAMHQAHPSNGSLVFGGFQGSNTSSPAPRPGGAYQAPDRMSYPPDMLSMPAVDNYGRPMLASPTVDGYPPALMNHHGPPTPHSFHGSQSSMQAEESGFVPYPAVNGHPGHNGYPTHAMGQPQRHMHTIDPHMGSLLPTAATSPSGFGIPAMQLQTLHFLRGGIEHADFADCTLEVNISNHYTSTDRPGSRPNPEPLRVPCHRFVLSQSPTLKHLMQTRGTAPGGVLSLEYNDPYLRPEAFYFTIRTLYGWDFDDNFLPTYNTMPTVVDEFDLALGYATAAKCLHLPHVFSTAIRHTWRRLLHWETIEMACAYAFPSAAGLGHPARHDSSSHSADFSVVELLDAIMAFIVNSFPPNFVLDTGVGDHGFSRLPVLGPMSRSRNMPAIAHGTSGPGRGSHSRHGSTAQAQMPRNPRHLANPRLSQIQFGDLSPQTLRLSGSGDQEVAAPRAPSPTPWDTILSRILLNLPFSILKQVLEHPDLGKSGGDLSAQARHNLISGIVAEREARRLRALSDGSLELKHLQERLASATQPLVVNHRDDFLVNNMGFKEEVFPGDAPYLVQSWDHGSGNISA